MVYYNVGTYSVYLPTFFLLDTNEIGTLLFLFLYN